jgi:hypothetical protein
MAAATGEVPLDKVPFPFRPMGGAVATGETWSKGWALARDVDGLLVLASEAAGLLPAGFADRTLEEAPTGDDTDDANAECGIYSVPMYSGDTFAATDGPAPVYYVNNREFGKTGFGASSARSIAGLFLCLDPDKPTTRAICWIGPEGYAIATAMLGIGASQPVADAVVTSLAACVSASGVLTASANGAIGAQDGVTLAVGDVVFIPKGTTNLPDATDAGPYVVLAVGAVGAKFKLVRPAWFAEGAAIPQAFNVKIGGGAIYGGSTWRTFCAASLVIGTDDPLFWPNFVSTSVTFVSGTSGTLSTLPIRSATKSAVHISNNGTAAHANTRTWRPTTFTPGDLGTAALVVSAESAPGTTNTSDVGVYVIGVQNF